MPFGSGISLWFEKGKDWELSRGRVCGFLGFRRVWQLLAIEDQISEYLSDDRLALPDASFWDSKFANTLA